jgi:plasmid stability protein
MGQLLVRNIPDSVKERLRRRAKQHGRSMEEEVRDILRRAAHEQEKSSVGIGTELANAFRKMGPGEFPKIRELRGYTIQAPDFDE